MSLENDAKDRSSVNTVFRKAAGVLIAIRSSFLLFIGFLGGLLLVLGAVGPYIPLVNVVVQGEISGMLGIWGATAILYCIVGILFLNLIGYSSNLR
ncbi:hypothetical protein [Halococcus agarilyticus]|uniref:hypothetical protein n=1 Tax=Halococcus agarilyticus TaxID=1232219 RepID=UPI0006776B8D|nr:hypothetical protein [Halococcus agarilyticus]